MGPDDQEFKYFLVFKVEKRPGGLDSEQYASFHGWMVGPHAAESGCTFDKKRGLCTNLEPFPQPHGIWELSAGGVISVLDDGGGCAMYHPCIFLYCECCLYGYVGGWDQYRDNVGVGYEG